MASKRYRILGFSPAPRQQTTPSIEAVASRSKSFSEEGAKFLIRDIATTLGRICLNDFLYDFNTASLLRHWPTFHFLKTRQSQAPIKVEPVALAGYLPPLRQIPPANPLWHVINFCEAQEREIKAIQSILKVLEGGECLMPTLQQAPIAAAFAAHFFRSSKWFEKNSVFLLAEILKCPLASYIACNGGLWHQEKNLLVRKTGDNPRLLVDLYSHPGTHELVEVEYLASILEENPHLELLTAASMQGPDLSQELIWSRFVDKAESYPIAAAFCLALMPTHPNSEVWEKVAMRSQSAMYWALRFARDQNDLNWPFKDKFVMELRKDAQWIYHLARDLDVRYARDYVRDFWPNPWAIELAQDMQLPFEVFLDAQKKTMNDPQFDEELRSSVILWTSDCVLKQQEARKKELFDEDENEE